MTRVLFSGYAPVHYLCFRPLVPFLTSELGAEVHLTGGLRSRESEEHPYRYDPQGLYGSFLETAGQIRSLEEVAGQEYDLSFTSSTTRITEETTACSVQIFHGVSFRNRAIRPENMSWDYYFLIGPYMRRRFESAGFLTPGDPRALNIGFMKTDVFFDETTSKAAAQQALGFDGSRPVLLFAPTGQKYNAMETMGLDVVEQLASTDRFDILIKLHDHPKNKIDWKSELAPFLSPHCVLTDEPDVATCQLASDVLITDASSVSIEYTLLDRPIIYLDVPNLIAKAAKREDSMLDLATWGRRTGRLVSHISELLPSVNEAIEYPDLLSEIRHKASQDIFYNPGKATETAAAWVRDRAGPSF